MAEIYSPVPPFTYQSNTTTRKMLVNATYGVHYIYPKVRDQVVIKKYEMKKKSISILTGIIYN